MYRALKYIIILFIVVTAASEMLWCTMTFWEQTYIMLTLLIVIKNEIITFLNENNINI